MHISLFPSILPSFQGTIPLPNQKPWAPKSDSLTLRFQGKERDLLAAAEWGKLEEVEALLKTNVDVNTSETQNQPPIILAARAGHTEIVTALIKAKANVNQQDCFGTTALIFASAGGNTTMVKELLQANADWTLKDNRCRTALLRAIGNGKTQVVPLLIEAPSDLESKNQLQDTALLASFWERKPEIAALFLLKEAETKTVFHKNQPLQLQLIGQDEPFWFTLTCLQPGALPKVLIPSQFFHELDKNKLATLYNDQKVTERIKVPLKVHRKSPVDGQTDTQTFEVETANVSGTLNKKLVNVFKRIDEMIPPHQILSLKFSQASTPRHTHILEFKRNEKKPHLLEVVYRDNELAVYDTSHRFVDTTILQNFQINLKTGLYRRSGYNLIGGDNLQVFEKHPFIKWGSPYHPFYALLEDIHRCTLSNSAHVPHGNSPELLGPILTTQDPQSPESRIRTFLNEGIEPPLLEVWKALEQAMGTWNDQKATWLQGFYHIRNQAQKG